LQRGAVLPGVPGEGCGQHGWVVCREASLPDGQARVFVPVGIKNQRVPGGVGKRRHGGRLGDFSIMSDGRRLPCPPR
jgi:hypothetical protein